jgi:cephalosporin-C deacetylase-like acetyl esterase
MVTGVVPTHAAEPADVPTREKRAAIDRALAQLEIDLHASDSDEAKNLRQMMPRYVRQRLDEANRASSRAWHEIESREAWQTYQRTCLENLRRGLGIDKNYYSPRELKQMVTRTIEGQGYTIENVVFESMPSLPVTGNLYLPRPRREEMPAILIAHSHHAPKTQGELQDMGVSWARAGCAVLVIDLPGHGERRQHPFDDADDYPKPFRASRQDYYFRYNSGRQLSASGSSLMAWMVHDLRRGIDLLFSRPGVHHQVILLGAVAGGGDPAAVTAAFDRRVRVAAPFNFGGPQPETTYPLPENAEETFRYAGGGSWESTRNLQGSASGGYLPWVIVGSIAPRQLIYGHEFVWDQEHDPVWARLQKIYGWFGVEDRLSFTHGHGRLSGQPPEASHCTNIGPAHRELIYKALEKWYGIPPAKILGDERRDASELLCLTDEAREEFDQRPLHETLESRIGLRLLFPELKRPTSRLPRNRPMNSISQRWSATLGNVQPAETKYTLHDRRTAGVINVERFTLETEPGINVPAALLKPAEQPDKPRAIVVMVAQQGKERLLAARRDLVAELLALDIAVCLADLRGSGETRPGDDRGRSSSATSISSSLEMLGQTMLGGQVRDLRSLVAHLRKQQDLDPKSIALWGDSLAEPYPPWSRLAAPLDAPDLPRQAEPMGASAVLLTALLDEHIPAIHVRGGLVSRRLVLKSPFLYLPHDALQPTAAHDDPGDWRDVLLALKPRAVRIEAMVDGLNRRVSRADLEREFLLRRDPDAAGKRIWHLVVNGEESRPIEAAAWLRDQLNR